MISFVENRVDVPPQLAVSDGSASVSVGNVRFKRARSNDPQTSQDAASNASKFSESHAGRIHLALIGKTLTAHEISTQTGLTVVQIDRRLPELRSAGLADVVRQDGKDMTRGGFRVWRAC